MKMLGMMVNKENKMKIRNGFVSNSSSSSFVISGFYMPKGMTIESVVEKMFGNDEDFPKKQAPETVRGCKHPVVNDAKFCPICGQPTWITNDFEDEYEDALGDFIADMSYSKDLKYIREVDFIGINIARASDDGFYPKEVDLQSIVDRTEELRKALGITDQKAKIGGMVEMC